MGYMISHVNFFRTTTKIFYDNTYFELIRGFKMLSWVIIWPNIYNVCHGRGSPCKFCKFFNIKEDLGLLKLAAIVLSLINPSPCYVNALIFKKKIRIRPLIENTKSLNITLFISKNYRGALYLVFPVIVIVIVIVIV